MLHSCRLKTDTYTQIKPIQTLVWNIAEFQTKVLLEAGILREFHNRYQNRHLNNYPNTWMWPIQTLIKPSHIQMLHSSRLKTDTYSHMKPIQTLVWNIVDFQTKILLEAESLREFHIRCQKSHLNNYPNTRM